MSPKPGNGTGTTRGEVEKSSKVAEAKWRWWHLPFTPTRASRPIIASAALRTRDATGAASLRSCSAGSAYAGSERGANRITLMPTRQIAAPIMSQLSGRCPSIAQPHSSALAM